MGQLVDGEWVSTEVLRQHDEIGRYFKRESVFRKHITADALASEASGQRGHSIGAGAGHSPEPGSSAPAALASEASGQRGHSIGAGAGHSPEPGSSAPDGASEFPAASGRYHLYSAVACPWAHRAVLFRVLKGLTPHVALWNTAQEENGEGWSFGPQGHVVPGDGRRVRWLHELYTIADPACTTRVTVPTLWDAQTRTVVNNESSEIIRMFNAAFGAIAGPTADYYPPALRRAIDETNAFVLRGINNAVNGCGYSITQEAYDEQVALLFASLDALEERLGRGRYLCGETQTEADWRLFPSLVRFDAVYYVAYKCNLRRLEDYHNLSNYLRELYQVPGIAEACDIAGMKRGVYSKAGPVGANGIVPAGPLVDHSRPHDRARFAAAGAHAGGPRLVDA